jgi:zinc transport system substrate-binding protein
MRTAILGLVAVVLATAACGNGEPVPAGGKMVVTTSVLPHAWLVRAVGGDRVEVLTLVGPGESPATYQPSDRQVSDVMRSTLFFATGVPFENGAWMKALRQSDVEVIDLRKGLSLRHLCAHRHEGDAHEHAGEDPHIWLAPKLLIRQAETVEYALSGADPDHAETYRDNLEATRKALEELDRDLAAALAGVKGRRLYVFHPSWGYFCDAYGLVQVPIEIEGKEPSESEVTKLVKRAREDAIEVIFVQPQIAGQSADAVARAGGATVRRIDPLAGDVPGNLRAVAERIAAAAK